MTSAVDVTAGGVLVVVADPEVLAEVDEDVPGEGPGRDLGEEVIDSSLRPTLFLSFETIFCVIYSLAFFKISASLGWNCSGEAVSQVPHASWHMMSSCKAPLPVE